jgi:hypothetical protein
MTDQSGEIPKQRGTSSGEIGQNPVETIGKRPAQNEEPDPASSEPVEDSRKPLKAHPDDAKSNEGKR